MPDNESLLTDREAAALDELDQLRQRAEAAEQECDQLRGQVRHGKHMLAGIACLLHDWNRQVNTGGGRARAVLYLDLDGTVRHGKDELGRFVNGPEDVVVFPEAVTMMRRWKDGGGLIVGVSNQGGIALGLVTFDNVAAAMVETHRRAGGLFDRLTWCSHHPDADNPELARCWCRKPSPGLLIEEAIDMARVRREFYPPALGLMVGDRDEDRECAGLAGLDFLPADQWRARAHQPAGEVG